MITSFIICLREGIEIFLVIIPLVIYFNKTKMYEMNKSVFKGGALGTVLAAILGAIIFSQVTLLNDSATDLFDGLLGIVLASLVLYSVVLLRKNKSLNTTPDDKFISLSQKGIFIISSITFFRELLEVTLFILTSSTASPLLVLTSSFLGFVCSALIVYLISKGISHFNINVVFYILNLFLVAIGAYYFGDGLNVLFGVFVSQIFIVGVLVYAVPSYFIILKKDLKKYINTIK